MKYEDLQKKMKFVSTERSAKGIPSVSMAYKRYQDRTRGSDTNIVSLNTKFVEQYVKGDNRERDISMVPLAFSVHEPGAVYVVVDPPSNEHALYARGVKPSKLHKPRSLAVANERVVSELCEHLEIDQLRGHSMYCKFNLELVVDEPETKVVRLTINSVNVEPIKTAPKPKRDKNFAKVA